MARINLKTGAGVFEVLARVCRSPQEALKQFVENAADAIEQARAEEGVIRLTLQYKPASNGHAEALLQRIAIQDNGIGMTPEKMKQVLHRIGDSEKIDLVLRGEHGIGLLAFALIAQELHLASTAKEGVPSSCLVLKHSWLKRGYGEVIERCPLHEHSHCGTIAYLEDILPEVAPQLLKEHIKHYLGQQFATDLRTNLYAMSISDTRSSEQIHPQRLRGVKILSSRLPLDHAGSAFVELYVLPWEMPDATISLYGRGGSRICLLTELNDFKTLPWIDQRLEGYIHCDHLKRTADKTAVINDQLCSSFVTMLRELEPKIQQLILEVSTESQEQRFNTILKRLSKLVDKLLRYREKGLLPDLPLITSAAAGRKGIVFRESEKHLLPQQEPSGEEKTRRTVTPAPQSSFLNIRLQSPPQEKSSYRSWYDQNQGVICINREHTEYLLLQREDRRCLRYLLSIWAKENLLQEYGADAERVADEMIGLITEAELLLG